MKSLSRVRLFATLWTVASQGPPSMGVSRQDYWSELPFASPEDLPDPGIEPTSPALASSFFNAEPTRVMDQRTGSKLGKEYIKAVYCYPAYFTSMHST